MQKPSHQPDFDELCRQMVQAARASDEDIQAAANAPFLYQRLRAQIAAEQKPLVPAPPQRTALAGFIAAFGVWQQQWRWPLAAALVGVMLLVAAGWQWLQVAPATPLVAQQETAPTKTAAPAAPTTSPAAAAGASEPRPKPFATAHKTTPAAARKAPRVAPRFAAETVAEETEIATDFMPLTYTADREDEGSHIVRMEVPREALIALGIPLAKDLTHERVKADIKVGEDGVALAIRLISNNNE